MNMAGPLLHTRYSEYQDTNVYASAEVVGVTVRVDPKQLPKGILMLHVS
jgi:hypothetical protein